MDTPHGDSHIVIPQTVVSIQVGDDTLVHNMITHQHYRLNEVGTRVWQLIGDGHTVDGVIGVIRSEYGLPHDTPTDCVRDDVVALLSELRHLGVVTAIASQPVRES